MDIKMVYNVTIMTIVNIADAKAHLTDYLRRVEAGETVTIARRNKPIAELRPVPQPPERPRPFGLCKGEFVVGEDFDAPLPQSILDSFEAS